MNVEEGVALSLTGTVRPLERQLTAPFSGFPCVAYRAHARVWNRLDVGGELVEDIDSTLLVAFSLVMADGQILVAAGDVVLDWPTHHIEPVPELKHEFLTRRELAQYAVSTFCDEGIVVAGNVVTIDGVIARDIGMEPASAELGYRETATGTYLTGYPGRPLTVRPLR